jgi:regulatory protein
MSVITKIEDQKNKKRVNIFVDDAFFCGLLKETAVIFKLKVGKEIDETVLKEAVFSSEVKSAFDKASDYLGLRMHTKKELFNKLLKKGYEKDVIEQAIKKLEEYHYVDDGLFAKQFTQKIFMLNTLIQANSLRVETSYPFLFVMITGCA